MNRWLIAIALLAAPIGVAAQAPQANSSQPADALSVIEGVRGGRHWIDDATAPPKSPKDSMACFEIEPGFKMQLVAAEPYVVDPVAIAFDHRGRMFAVEYSDYPIGPPDGGEPLSKIVLLEDENNDGQVDRRTVFADRLDFAHSLMPFKDGLLVGAKTQILYISDTDGDGVSDERTVMFDGFTPAHPQMQIGNPRWGIDNWVYCNYGPGKVHSPEIKEPVTLPRKDFRFDPRTGEFKSDGGLGQFGNTIDRWGHRFYCTNRNPIMTTMFQPEVAQRNPFATVSKTHYDVGRSGGDTRVYPLVNMKSNYLSHAGTHTSACGTTANLGDLLGSDCRNSVFVCEPIGHLVTRSIVNPDGAVLNAERARARSDFIASTDTWFRPASMATGPDGAMYLADMYRLWVEHPKFLPAEIAERLDWRAGEDRGRIYRIVKTGTVSPPFKSPKTSSEMVALLGSDNGWRQFLGQRLIVQRQQRETTNALRQLMRTGRLETTRQHAMWTLDGIDALKAQDVIVGINDQDWHVRRDAARLAAKYIDDESVLGSLTAKVSDSAAAVRLQVLVTLGDSKSPAATEAIASIAGGDGKDPWFSSALMTAVETRAAAVLDAILHDARFTRDAGRPQIELVKRLASAIGARGNTEELSSTLHLLANSNIRGDWWRAAIVSGLGKGLPRHRGDLGRVSLATLLSKPPSGLAESVAPLRTLLDKNVDVAVDKNQPPADRSAAVELLAFRPISESISTFDKLLANDQPTEVQSATIEALSGIGSIDAAKLVLSRWSQLGPTVRAPALTLLLRRSESTKLALEAMQAGSMRTAALSIDQRVRLLKHRDESIRRLATDLLGGAVSANRREVAKEYSPALEIAGSAIEGKKVFTRVCANCHKINGEGHDTGPDLSDVRNRSKLALLYDILDPNAKVEPRFSAYSVLTLDGKVLTGLIASETADSVVLKMAEGKLQTIARDEIDEVKISNVSLMPEGIEKDVKVSEMAHLLSFLMNPGNTQTESNE